VRKIAAATGIITTVAGTGTAGFSGDGRPATSARLDGPEFLAVDTAGNLYIADFGNDRVRKVAAATGIITTVAGTGTGGFSGDGGPATSAQINGPEGLAVDITGNLFIADSYNDRIRKVAAATGIITTVAGTGTPGFSGDGGPATSAHLSEPVGIAVDSLGNIFICDSDNHRVRKVAASTGIITTVAGNAQFREDPGDNGPATSALLAIPVSVAVDTSGNLYISDLLASRIRVVRGPL
jgi:hypothetical protein